jgi:hypothetical protein
VMIEPHINVVIGQRQIGDHIIGQDAEKAVLDMAGLRPTHRYGIAQSLFKQSGTNDAIKVGPRDDSHVYDLHPASRARLKCNVLTIE